MSTLTWIVASGLLMSAIALVGSITLILPAPTLDRLLLPLLPEVDKQGNSDIPTNLVHLVSFMLGLVLLLVVAP